MSDLNVSVYDVAVIGGGPAGYVAAIRAAQLGKKVVCIESRGTLGGTCLNVGCIPSKAMLEASEFYEKTAKHASEYGVVIDKVSADVPAMIDRKDKIVQKFTKGIEGLFKKNKVDYLKGTGSFIDEGTIECKGQDNALIKASSIIIATGSTPVELPFAKFDGKKILSSTEALELKTPPKKMVVIGGGVIGLEMGSVWRRLGSEVTIIEATPSILAGSDSAVQKTMAQLLKKQGLIIHTEMLVKTVDTSQKTTKVTAQNSAGDSIVFECEVVLVAVGRRPNTSGLGLDRIGITLDARGKVPVKSTLQTNVHSHIYAVGDVINGPMLAHKAEEEGVAAAEHLAGQKPHVNYMAIPNVVYTWPEVATVGWTEEEVKHRGIRYSVGQFPFSANGRAMAGGNTEGMVKVITDAETDRLLGVHMVGPHASELIAEISLAFEFGASAEDVGISVHAHPTLAEVTKEACLAALKRAIHI